VSPEATRWSRRSMAVTAMCFVLNMVDGVNVFALTYVAPELQKQFGAGPETFSIVFSIGLVGMALGGLVLAPQADRWGRRPIILLALALMAGAMVASAYAGSIATLCFDRLLVGTGIGTVLASITALSAGFAPTRYRNLAAGIPQAGYPVGATVTGFLTAWALPRYGWPAIFAGAGLSTLVLLPLCYFILPEAPDHATRQRTSLRDALGGARTRNSALLWACTICGFMALYFIASWITKLAIEAGLPPTEAIIASAVYNGGAVVGTVALSIAATRYDIRKLILITLLFAAGLFLVFGGVRLALGGLLVTSFLIGVTLQGGVNCNYALVAGAYPSSARATGLGWAMGIGRFGALSGPLVAGAAMARGFSLLAVFAMFCVPLLVNGIAAQGVGEAHDLE
jgi:AAHS family 4-hydroxybenzoate transporter-like MFS transporter